MSAQNETEGRWYEGIARYQWLVLAIASVGWMFDVFEGQIYAVYKTPAMGELPRSVSQLSLNGLSERRAQVWPGGLSILAELLNVLNIGNLRAAAGGQPSQADNERKTEESFVCTH